MCIQKEFTKARSTTSAKRISIKGARNKKHLKECQQRPENTASKRKPTKAGEIKQRSKKIRTKAGDKKTQKKNAQPKNTEVKERRNIKTYIKKNTGNTKAGNEKSAPKMNTSKGRI